MQETENKNKESTYKKALLKSGLPFEYEVCNYLRKNVFIVDFEYPYIKEDENGIQKEFLYDKRLEKAIERKKRIAMFRQKK